MIRFETDHYFQIGASHLSAGKPCQDYALSGSNNLVACAIVSDGCSTGRHTDVGSRVLTFSTLQAIRDHAKASNGALDTAMVSITSRQQQILSTSRALLGLERDDMLATCAYVYVSQLGGFVHVQGDGVVGTKYRDGTIHMTRYEWANNTPFYPSYGDGSIEQFIGVHGGDLDSHRITRDFAIRSPDPDRSLWDSVSSTHPLRQGLEGMVITITPEELSQIEYIAVFSDGATQVEGCDWKDVVTNLLSFKSSTGEFAKRRMIREIKEMQKIGKGPIDDIAFGVVRVLTSQEGEIVT